MDDLFSSMGRDSNELPDSISTVSGISLAKVVNIKDPKNYGRVKCKYITADKNAGETGWIYCVTPFGGKEYGCFFHPNVNDIVALAYQNGDIHRPFVIGRLWVQDSTPPVAVQNGKNEEYKIITPNKSYIDFFDGQGKEKITAGTPANRTITLDDGNQTITVTDGKSTISIGSQNGITEITCEKKLVIKVGSGVTIECDGMQGTVSINANKSVEVSAAQYSVKSSGTAEINANGSVTVKSSGMMTVQGSVTKIN